MGKDQEIIQAMTNRELADRIDPRLPRPGLIPMSEPHMTIPYSDLIAASDALRSTHAPALTEAEQLLLDILQWHGTDRKDGSGLPPDLLIKLCRMVHT